MRAARTWTKTYKQFPAISCDCDSSSKASYNFGNFPTLMENRIDTQLKEFEARLMHRLEKMHSNFLKWLIGIVLAQIVGIFIPIMLAVITHLLLK